MTRRERNLLVVISDDEHARFVRPAQNHALNTQATLNASGHRPAGLGADYPGAASRSGAWAHPAFAPHHDPHWPAKEWFARTVADRVMSAVRNDGALELVLVAPPHMLFIIHEELDPASRSRVIGVLAKDLMKVPDHFLQPHLKTWVRPARHTAL